MPASPTPHVPRRVITAAAGCVAAALLLDATGLALDAASLWRVGSWLHFAAVVLASAGLVVAGVRWLAVVAGADSRGGLASLAALAAACALLAIGRWIRGHPAVPPDPPILFAAGCALLLLLLGMLPYGTAASTRVRFVLSRDRLRR
jgi:hypothetical protein